MHGYSETAHIKKRIQALARQIVIARDGGCVLRHTSGIPRCNGYKKSGELVLQADHLVTRSNSATFGDTRLIVCLCKGHHGWKSMGDSQRKSQYDALIRGLLLADRVAVWESAEAELWRPAPAGVSDWLFTALALKRELASYQMVQSTG